jgi:DNA-binding transcriptional regulator GbsR (MarR family)
MDYLQTLLTIFWVIGWTARTVAGFRKKFQQFITEENDRRIDETNKRIDETNRRIDDLQLQVLRSNMHNTELPLSERIACGDKYIELWGNGESKLYYEGLKKKYLEILHSNPNGWDG